MVKPRRRSVTGRDGYIITKALAYAVEAIAMLPEERQEASDRADMLALLINAVGVSYGDRFRSNAFAHLDGKGRAKKAA